MAVDHDLVEDLVFQCLEALDGGGTDAVDAILATYGEAVRVEAKQMLATLLRVGLAGGGDAQQGGRLGPYTLFERVGAGAMGVVYRARHSGVGNDGEVDDRDLALKLLHPGHLPVRGARIRFRREIAALRELDHPGICPILGDGEADGVPFLVMPFLPGQSLRERFAASRPPRDDLLAILSGVADALHHAHERGFVHRDVKPANVMVRDDGTPVLLDFGLARFEQRAPESALTLSGGVVGTPAYMAPEQVAGRDDVDRRCDVYALGVVLYEGLTGRVPHEAPTRESLYRRILAGDVVRPSRLAAGVPRDLDVVCLTAIERDVARRYRTAAEFAADLERVQRGERPQARLPGPVLRTRRWIGRNPLPAALLALVSVALVTILLLFAERTTTARIDAARALAAAALQVVAADPDVALHLALHAHERAPEPEVWTALQAALGAPRAEHVLAGHQDPVRSLEFSPDSARLVSAAVDGNARVWDLASGTSVELAHGDGGAAGATFHPTSDVVVTGGESDGSVSAFRASTGERVWRVVAHDATGPVNVLRWSPDGDWLVTGGGGRALLWTAGGTRRAVLLDGAEAIGAAAWLDARSIAIGAGRSLGVWRSSDAALGLGPAGLEQFERQEHYVFEAPVVAVHPNPRDSHLAIVVTDEPIPHLLRTGTLLPLRGGFSRPVAGAGWSPDGALAFATAFGGATAIFTAAGEPRGGRFQIADHVGSAVANPLWPWFAFCGDQGSLEIVGYGRAVYAARGAMLRGTPLAISSDGQLLASTSWKHQIQVWRTWDPNLPVFQHAARSLAAEWFDGGERVLTAGGVKESQTSGYFAAWDSTTGRPVDLRPDPRPWHAWQVLAIRMDEAHQRMFASLGYGHVGAIQVFARDGDGWRPDGAPLTNPELGQYAFDLTHVGDDQLLICDATGRLLVWDLRSREVVQRLPEQASTDPQDIHRRWMSLAATLDGATVWIGGAPGYLHRFDRGEDGRYAETSVERLPASIDVVRLLPDGSLMVGGSDGWLVRQLPDGSRIAFRGHVGNVKDVASCWSNEEARIASSDTEGSVLLWREDGTLVREIQAHSGGIWSLRFSPDGRRLLTASVDGSARIWPVRTVDLLDLARERRRPLDSEQREHLRTLMAR